MTTLTGPINSTVWTGVWKSTLVPTIKGTIKVFLKPHTETVSYETIGSLDFDGCYRSGRCEIIHPYITMDSDKKADGNVEEARVFQCELVELTDNNTKLRAKYISRVPNYDEGTVELSKSLSLVINCTVASGTHCIIL